MVQTRRARSNSVLSSTSNDSSGAGPPVLSSHGNIDLAEVNAVHTNVPSTRLLRSQSVSVNATSNGNRDKQSLQRSQDLEYASVA